MTCIQCLRLQLTTATGLEASICIQTVVLPCLRVQFYSTHAALKKGAPRTPVDSGFISGFQLQLSAWSRQRSPTSKMVLLMDISPIRFDPSRMDLVWPEVINAHRPAPQPHFKIIIPWNSISCWLWSESITLNDASNAHRGPSLSDARVSGSKPHY